jgi:hypothetical protein
MYCVPIRTGASGREEPYTRSLCRDSNLFWGVFTQVRVETVRKVVRVELRT